MYRKTRTAKRRSLRYFRLSGLSGRQILADHQRHLEDDGMVELPQVQPGELLDLLQAEDQGISMDEQLPGSLGDIQVVLEELVDGEQRLLIQGVDGILLEHFAQEDLAQGGGKRVEQTADAQILIVEDAALGVEYLAHLDGGCARWPDDNPRLIVA